MLQLPVISTVGRLILKVGDKCDTEVLSNMISLKT